MICGFNGGYIPGEQGYAHWNHQRVIEPEGFDFRKIKPDYSVPRPDDGGGYGDFATSGLRVSTDYLPRRMRYTSKEPPLDLDFGTGMTYASPRFRDLVERIDPGVHQFEPIEYVDGGGRHVADMFSFFVCRRLDTIDEAHSTMILWRGRLYSSAKGIARQYPEDLPADADLEVQPKLVFDDAKRLGHHLWREIHEMGHPTYCSGEFRDAALAEGITGFASGPREMIDG